MHGGRRASFWPTSHSYARFGGGFYPSGGSVGGWVDGWDGAGGMISPHALGLSNWDYGLALLPHLLSPSSPSVICFMATRCIYLY